MAEVWGSVGAYCALSYRDDSRLRNADDECAADAVVSLPLKGGGIGGLRPPFLHVRTPTRSVGYGGGQLVSAKAAPHPRGLARRPPPIGGSGRRPTPRRAPPLA